MDTNTEFKRFDGPSHRLSSFHGVTITASLEKLVSLFGEPGPGDVGYKVKHEWVLQAADGTRVTVYDWKDDGARSHEWNVGGQDKVACLRFARWFATV